MSTRKTMTGAQVADMVLKYAVEAVNLAAAKVMSESIDEAPLGPTVDEGGDGSSTSTLRESAELDPATKEYVWATISYNTPYAAAQHEGHATMHHAGKTWEWVVKHYTTPGTKKKFLEDPLKAFIPEYEPFVAKYIKAKLEKRGVPEEIAMQIVSQLGAP